MSPQADVIVVGTRCAGSALAIQLARAGQQVVAVDKAEFPSDTPSTHFFQVEGLLVLQRLGVLDQLLATGAPAISHVAGAVDDIIFGGPWPLRPDDPAGAMCVRRPVLDTILVAAARDAGVDVRTGTTVRDLVWESDRVVGARVEAGGQTEELRARVVVGADGRSSTVARLVGARRYHETPSPRVFTWAYFDGGVVESPPRSYLVRRGDSFVIAAPCDDGRFMVVAGAGRERFEPEFGRSPQALFDGVLADVPEVAKLVEGASRDGRLHSMARYDGFMRESAGPGWVLVGDAGHFKDPTLGQGISDAFRQSETLAPAILDGLTGRRDLDAALQDWWAWRDKDAFEKHWFSSDFGRAGSTSALELEVIGRLASTRKGQEQFVDLFNHRVRPSQVLTPARLFGATGRLLARRGTDRRQVLRDTRGLLRTEVARRRLRRRPVYVAAVSQESDAEVATVD